MDEIINITLLALVDAINPCTIAVQTLLLSALLLYKGRKDALKGGILFSLTIFVSYFLYGLGFLEIIYGTSIDKYLEIGLKVLLIIMASMELYAYISYKPGFRSVEMPTKLRPIAKKLLYSVENPLMAIPVAFACSVLLLPCSSGPYLSALVIMRNDVGKIVKLIYYNSIFVIPMILITLLIYFGMKPEKIAEWKEKHIKTLHLISGLLLLGVLFML